jgi:hypothetical protein
MPTIDELVASVMHLPLHCHARRLRELIQHYVRRSLVDHHTATPAAAHEALHLWNVVATPPSIPVAAPRRRRNARIAVGNSRAFNHQGDSAGAGTSAPPAAQAGISINAGRLRRRSPSSSSSGFSSFGSGGERAC